MGRWGRARVRGIEGIDHLQAWRAEQGKWQRKRMPAGKEGREEREKPT